MLLVTLDSLAQRYGLLPSQALDSASTLDLRVMEIANRHASRKNEPTGKIRPELSQKQMKAMIEQARKKE
jgi:hypothetical protein